MITPSSISRHLRAVVLLVLGMLIMLPADISGGLTDQFTQSARAAKKKKKEKTRKPKKTRRSKSKKKTRKSRKRRMAKKRRTRKARPAVTTLYASPDGREFIHRGKRGIIISRDTAGTVRGMAPLTSNVNG